MDIIQIITAGSVDDGKSTLIGRLLYETNSIEDDILQVIEKQSTNTADAVNFAYFTDGLKSERELGITIDVAYRYFKTDQQKFILVDAPGHVEYTRNMITGASKCDAIIILIDAQNGVIEQTKRHSYIAKLLNIPNVIVAINKMDLIANSEERYQQIKSNYLTTINLNPNQQLQFVPISALKGYNIVENSPALSWYKKKPLLDCINAIKMQREINTDVKAVIQNVTPQETQKVYIANLLQGTINKKDGFITSNDKEISFSALYKQSKEVNLLKAPAIFSFTLQNKDIALQRGTILADNFVGYTIGKKELQANVFWMQETQITVGKELLLQIQSQTVMCKLTEIQSVLDINTLKEAQKNVISFNDIATVIIALETPLVFSSFGGNKNFGSGILIDKDNNFTVGVVLV